jgi:hypothetical protein
MPVYTVHAPAMTDVTTNEAGPRRADRLVFVRDGFHGWAVFFAPLWLAAHRLWLALFAYVAVALFLSAAIAATGISGWPPIFAFLGVSLLVALEGGTLRRWTLARRGWRELGIVNAPDLEAAERRFFDSWTAGAGAARPATPAPDRMPTAAGASGVIGLFPEPESRR